MNAILGSLEDVWWYLPKVGSNRSSVIPWHPGQLDGFLQSDLAQDLQSLSFSLRQELLYLRRLTIIDLTAPTF